MTFYYSFKFGTIQYISLSDPDAAVKRSEPLRRAHEHRYRVPTLNGLADDLNTNSSSSSHYKQLHSLFRFSAERYSLVNEAIAHRIKVASLSLASGNGEQISTVWPAGSLV